MAKFQTPSDGYLAWFERNGAAPPEHSGHQLVDSEDAPLSEQLKKHRVVVSAWRLEGNQLIGTFDGGEFSNYIEPNYLLISGEPDVNGHPQLRMIDNA